MRQKEFNELVEEHCFNETAKEKIKTTYNNERSYGLLLLACFITVLITFIVVMNFLETNYEEQLETKDTNQKMLTTQLTTELCYMYGMPAAKNAKLYDNGKAYISCEDQHGKITEWKIPQAK